MLQFIQIISTFYRYLDSYGVDSTQYGVAHSDELWQLWNIYFGNYWMDRPEVLHGFMVHLHLAIIRTSRG